ncbi:ATPase domain-containing protein [Sulfurifustis variabilis]|uniref:ATPase domain-containing protein n=1 Tax=Sulfurifustis variabilis TaxID=1675686 RepID=UPI000BBADBE7|nr:ATPase domain-containing protein [Sulfurifustis variabilis]
MGETEGSAGGEPVPSNPGLPLAATGIPGLDAASGGGFPRCRMYLLRGGSGTGKTTLGLQFLLAGREAGEESLYLGLSESRDEIESIARSHDWSLAGIHIHEYSIADQLRAETRQTIFNAAEIELPETMAALLEAMDRVRPARCVVDSLAELRLLADDALRYRRQILLLKEYVVVNRCTVLLLDEHRGPNDVEIENLMHGVILLDHEAAPYGHDRRRLRIKKLRGRRFSEGYHDYRIATGGISVYPRMTLPEGRPAAKVETMSTGVAALDRLLGGGVDRGGSLLLVGPAGTGKSSVAARVAASAAARGEGVAIYLFDESREMFLTRCAGLGLPLPALAETGAALVRAVDPAEMPFGEFANELRRAVDAGARVVVIDTLVGLRTAMREERFLPLQLRELLAYLARSRVVTVLVDREIGGARGPHSTDTLSYLADTVVAFRYYECGGEVRPVISVLKRRAGEHEHAIRELRIGPPEGVDLGPPLTRLRGSVTGGPVCDDRDPDPAG